MSLLKLESVISLEQVKLDLSNLVCRVAMVSSSMHMIDNTGMQFAQGHHYHHCHFHLLLSADKSSLIYMIIQSTCNVKYTRHK